MYTRQGNLALIPEDGSLGVVWFRQVRRNWQKLTRKSMAALTSKGIRRTLTGETAAQLVWGSRGSDCCLLRILPDEIKSGRTTVVDTPAVLRTPPTKGAGPVGYIDDEICV